MFCCKSAFSFKESAKTISDVLEDKKKFEWSKSNSSLAIEIAEVTESFGEELARKWTNETSTVGSLEPNIGKVKLSLHRRFCLDTNSVSLSN